MNLGLEGKVAMVAAGSKGIGFATAKLLIEEGCLVSICGRTKESLDAATELLGPKSRSYVADVSSPDQIEDWFDKTRVELGLPQILVTNTGGPPAGSWQQMTDAQWQAGFDSTLLNIVRMVRLAAPLMADEKWGRIVHITSLVAKEPNVLLPISSTLRAGIMALTRLQATELAPKGITVNGVLPGHTLTDRQRHLADIRATRDNITPEEALQRQGNEVPVGRLATPEEVASAIVFLCSHQAAYVTGESLLVDGGLTKGI
ncbi:MAG TPA: SDR family oxidoreductase [Fimbriimonas sp.]|nr:SDR family oxidoreductase [Fimbriimonas sp.]